MMISRMKTARPIVLRAALAALLMAGPLATALPAHAQVQQTAPVEAPATQVETPVVAPGEEAAAVERDERLPHDLSPWGMFMAADWVVKSVMIGLIFASFVTWTIWLAKTLEIAGAKRRLSSALDKILDARSLSEAGRSLENGKGPAVLMVRAAGHERAMVRDSIDHHGPAGLKERVTSHLMRIEAEAQRNISRGTGILATIGSTAPFVGLFGTVWGIMNSFIGISQAQTTNLAIVAPGIAEALFATALGLVAAIPAVVIYNAFARSVAGYRLLLGHASAAVERLVSRDVDHARAGEPSHMSRAAE
ncbi:tonB-system energizer ExbB [Aliihoeflea sp. 2WW]|uniref:tonB-system energizer ExbB n=1 Tax=Aliihoeflea sp. 2WW TaxID=1381123 RepID=UPI0009DEF5B8|nr:tonB-system energizer ExbB [Aliihoeflea sp. 2WW]